MAEGVVYVVQAIHWEYNDEGGNDCHGRVPLRAYRDPRKAHAEWLEKETAARASWGHPNPAAHSFSPDRGPSYLGECTTLDEAELAARLEARGVLLPDEVTPASEGGQRYDWTDADWWRLAQAAVPPEELPWLWGLFDRIRFFEVVELPLSALTGPGSP